MSTLAPDLKAKWLAALRSGEFIQGHTQLRSSDGSKHCCLGVLCVVAGLEINEDGTNTTAGNGYEPIQKLGLPPREASDLYCMNDDHFGTPQNALFSDIADHIEKNL